MRINPNFKTQVFRWGAIIGLCNISIITLVYLLDIAILLDFKYSIFLLLVNIILLLISGVSYSGISEKIQLRYIEVYTFLLLTTFTFCGIIFIFKSSLFTLIDSSSVDQLADSYAVKMTEIMERIAVDQHRIDASYDRSFNSVKQQFSIAGFLRSMFIEIIKYSLIGLIVSFFIFRRNHRK